MELGEGLFLARGYTGFSYADIADRLNIRNAAIHYHFPSKRDLLNTIVKKQQHQFLKWTDQKRAENNHFPDLLRQTIDYVYTVRLNAGHQVCAIGNSAVSAMILPEETLQVIRSMVHDIINWFEEILSKGKKSGSFYFLGHSKDKASLIAASLAGALQIARLAGENHFHIIAENIITELCHNPQQIHEG